MSIADKSTLISGKGAQSGEGDRRNIGGPLTVKIKDTVYLSVGGDGEPAAWAALSHPAIHASQTEGIDTSQREQPHTSCANFKHQQPLSLLGKNKLPGL